jgi:hypothetical protein
MWERSDTHGSTRAENKFPTKEAREFFYPSLQVYPSSLSRIAQNKVVMLKERALSIEAAMMKKLRILELI